MTSCKDCLWFYQETFDLYPNKSPEFLKEYFHGEPDSEIIKYIFGNKGKRLEKVGK